MIGDDVLLGLDFLHTRAWDLRIASENQDRAVSEAPLRRGAEARLLLQPPGLAPVIGMSLYHGTLKVQGTDVGC